jgi:hypothetical protein
MYTIRNFKTKKELKAAVNAWNDYAADPDLWIRNGYSAGLTPRGPRPVEYYQPGPFGGNEPLNGEFSVEGPHYPQPHRWYARVVAKDGVIIKVK